MHDQPRILISLEISPSELGVMTRAVMSCLDTDVLKDEEYRATLLTLRDRLFQLAETFGGFATRRRWVNHF